MCAAPSPKRQRRTVFWPDMEKQHRRSPSPHLRQVLRCGGDREAKHTQIVMPRPRHLSRATPALRHPRPTWDAAPASRPEGEETAFHRVHKPRPLLAIIVAAFHCGCQRSFTSSGRLPHRRRERTGECYPRPAAAAGRLERAALLSPFSPRTRQADFLAFASPTAVMWGG